MFADEPFGVRVVGVGQDFGAGGPDRVGAVEVHVAGVFRPMPECRCSWLYQRKNLWQKARASWIEPNWSGKSGRYFRA